MSSILSDLYHGELRPNERGYPADSDVGILLESFRQNEKWLSELLDGKAKAHLLELVNIHDELVGTVTYDSFREGFVLGSLLIMEVVGQAGDEWGRRTPPPLFTIVLRPPVFRIARREQTSGRACTDML